MTTDTTVKTETLDVTIYVKVGGELFGSYGQGDDLAEVGTFAVEVPLDSAKPFLAAAEAAFVLGQKMGTDAKGRDYPRDVRSVSKGDVIRVTRQDEYLGHFAVESFGFQQIPHPTRRQFVPLAGQSLHTSRE
jgi:hypothetical protein